MPVLPGLASGGAAVSLPAWAVVSKHPSGCVPRPWCAGERVKLRTGHQGTWLDGFVSCVRSDGHKTVVQVTYSASGKTVWIDPAAWGESLARMPREPAQGGAPPLGWQAPSSASCASTEAGSLQDDGEEGDENSDDPDDDPSHPYNSLRMMYSVPEAGATCRSRGRALHHLSRRRLAGDAAEEEGVDGAPPGPRCPQGHPMRCKVAREILGLVRLARPAACTDCGAAVDPRGDAVYRCGHCRVSYCVSCAAGLAEGSCGAGTGQPKDTMQEIMPGDILYAGPDRWSIHHTILVRSRVQAVTDADITRLCELQPDEELLECHTVETARSLSSEMTAWYPTVSYFVRGGKRWPRTVLVADKPVDSNVLNVLEEPVPMKVAMHPLRGEKFDNHIFNEAVIWGCGTARPYGKRQAVRSFLSQARMRGEPCTLEPKAYPTPEAREALRSSLHESWEARPICASLCIKVWQMYFELLGRAAGEPDEAVMEVLRWMPVYSNRTTPSALLKALTQRGWRVQQL